jgi:hypothetical protein
LKSEIEKRDHTEMVTLLKSFKATPFNLDEKAEDNDIKKFQKMKAADPVGFARMVDLFKAAEAQIEQSNLLKNQLGSPRGGSVGSAEAQLQAKAEELVTKSANGISKEQAFEQACQQNPELVKQYRKEQQ